MAQSLSTTTGSEIERVTRLCQRLEFFVSQPLLQVQALSHGESNQSYYVKTARAEYVLRCYPAESMVCRQQELRCQHAAAAQGLAPAPLCLNNHYQVMLSEFISNAEAFNFPQHGQALLLTSLVRFHQLSVQTPQLDNAGYLRQLAAALPAVNDAEPALLTALDDAARQLAQLPTDIVLCHLDLHAGNLLVAQQKLWLLDFEYSQQADSSLDLAAVCLHFNLSPVQQLAMLQLYRQLRQLPDEAEAMLVRKLEVAKILYSGYCWLWYLAMPNYQQQAKRWQQRLQSELAAVL